MCANDHVDLTVLRRLPPTYALVYVCAACGSPVKADANHASDTDGDNVIRFVPKALLRS
jgi:hypothetical protein